MDYESIPMLEISFYAQRKKPIDQSKKLND